MAVDSTLKEGKGPQFQRFVNDVSSEIDDFESRITSQNTRITAIETPEDWHLVGAAGEIPFDNSWVNFGGSPAQQDAQYRIVNNIVFIKGLVKAGVIDTAIFTLPLGYRPAGPASRAAETFAVVSNDLFGKLNIMADGRVILQLGSNSFVYLSCSFSV